MGTAAGQCLFVGDMKKCTDVRYAHTVYISMERYQNPHSLVGDALLRRFRFRDGMAPSTHALAVHALIAEAGSWKLSRVHCAIWLYGYMAIMPIMPV